jgi:hypothetical protein
MVWAELMEVPENINRPSTARKVMVWGSDFIMLATPVRSLIVRARKKGKRMANLRGTYVL